MEFSAKAAARRKPPCCGVWMSLQQLFLPQFLYAAGFVGKPDLRALPEPRLRHPLPVPDQGAAQGACYSPLPGGAGQDCRGLPGADGAVRANLKKRKKCWPPPESSWLSWTRKNCWPTARRACGKICEKKRRFPSCEGERFSVVWYAGDKEIPTRSDHT